MTEIGTTSLDQLPINSQQSGNYQPVQQTDNGNNNLGEAKNVKIQNYGQQINDERGNDTMVNNMDYNSQMASVLQDAATTGATNLPSRDIPQNTANIQQDQEIKANYIRNTNTNSSNDYIGNILDRENIIQNDTINRNKSDNLDFIYQQFQMPVLVAIIYFLFQLPTVRKHILTFLPSLFNKDGNPNLSGYMFNSILFGITYSLLMKSITYFSI